MSDIKPFFDPDGPAMTPVERKRMFRGTPAGMKRGYAAPPGTGPKDETCASCAFIQRKQMAKTYLKCGLFPRQTGGAATDILARSPACRLWAAPKPTLPQGAA